MNKQNSDGADGQLEAMVGPDHVGEVTKMVDVMDYCGAGAMCCYMAARLEYAEVENERLRAACNSAIAWLEGWASAEPYLAILRVAVKPNA